jgi:hypothetical protein
MAERLTAEQMRIMDEIEDHCAAQRHRKLEQAAKALINDVRRRYPGEELRCPYMRDLDAACSANDRGADHVD